LNSVLQNPAYTNTDKRNSQAFRNQLPTILFLVLIFFLNFISRVIFSPLMSTIEMDLNLSHSEAGSLFLFISCGYFIALLGSGLISSRLTHRRTIWLSALAVGLTLMAIAFSHSKWSMRAGLFITGLGAGIYLPSGLATITALINPRQWGKAIAIHELAPNLGFVLAPVLSEIFLIWFSWRQVLALIGLTSFLVGIVYVCRGHGAEFAGESPSFQSFRKLWRERSFKIMLILFGLGISSFLGVYTMLPLYLVAEQGLDRNLANMLVAASRIAGLGIVFLGGWATDRFGPKRTLTGVFLLTGFTTMLLGISSGYGLFVFVFVQPIFAVCFPPAALVALSRIGPPDARNLAVSFAIPSAFLIGGGVIPIVIGIMGDAGSFGLGIALVGGLIILASILPRYLQFPDKPFE